MYVSGLKIVSGCSYSNQPDDVFRQSGSFIGEGGFLPERMPRGYLLVIKRDLQRSDRISLSSLHHSSLKLSLRPEAPHRLRPAFVF